MAYRAQLAVVLAVVMLAMGSCTASPPTGPRSDLAGRTIEVAATWSGTEQKNFEAVLHEFSRQTGVTVRYTSGGNDLPILINSRLAGGAPPDIAFIPQPGVVAELAHRGALKPLTGAAAEAVRDNYSSAWQQMGTVDGTLYGLYFKVANKSVIWYREDAFDTAGVHPPATWDEFVAVSKQLADAGITPIVAAGGDGWVLTDWFENVYLRVAGAENYDKLARHALPWTDPTVVRALEILADYWRTPAMLQGGPAGALQVTFTQAIADVFGAKPKSAMLFEGDFVASEIAKLGSVRVGDTARFFTWPAIDGSEPAVITAGDQGVALTDNPATMALMAYLASPEAAAIMAGKGGFMSANRNLDLSAYPDPTMKQLAAMVGTAKILRFDLSDLTPQAFGGGTSAHMWVLLQDFLSKPIAPSDIAAALEAAAAKDFVTTP